MDPVVQADLHYELYGAELKLRNASALSGCPTLERKWKGMTPFNITCFTPNSDERVRQAVETYDRVAHKAIL